jgi:hypothetical protein
LTKTVRLLPFESTTESWLFPVSQGLHFLYDFQQSLKPPLMIGYS